MTYDEFKLALDVSEIYDNSHIGLVLNREIPDDGFMAIFQEHVDNLRVCFHRTQHGNTYIIMNKDVELKETLENYEIVNNLPINPMILATQPEVTE
jgi:hypothetical protein